MCTTTIIAFSVSVIEGVAGGVLQNYRLNDLKNGNSRGGDVERNENEKDTQERLLPDSLNSLKRKALEDFDDEDCIYEEFSVPSEIVEDTIGDCEEISYFTWKHYRGSPLNWMKMCIIYSFYIVVLCSFFISTVAVGIMFIDINTADVCFNTKWHNLPKSVQRVRVTMQVIEGWILQFFHIFTLICVFGFKLIDQLHLLGLNIFAACFDSIYRLFLQVYDMYNAWWKSFPLNVIFVGIMIFNSYIMSRYYYSGRKRKMILTFQLGSQFILGTLTLYMTNYVIIPWFVTLTPTLQAIVAAVTPICGAISKAISRIAIQSVSHVNHPGTSYIFVIAAYAAAALVYRTLQAEIQSFRYFTLLCIAHGFVGLLERLSVILRDHFYTWFYKRFLKRESSFKSFIGSFRTPRTQRLVADLTICNIIHEITALVYTNAMVQLYALQFGRTESGDVFDSKTILKEFFIRTFVAVMAEYFFTVFGIFILTWYLNIPVISVWKKKWKSLVLNNVVICSILVIYVTQYLTEVVSAKYKHLYNKNGTITCDTSELLFFS